MIAAVSALLALALVAAQASPILIRGTSRCPGTAEVAAILPELLPSEATYADVAWIEAIGSDLLVELRSREGEVLVTRRLPSSGSCAELATLAAVIIASWTAERTPGISLLQPGVPLPRPVAPPPPVGALASPPASPPRVVSLPRRPAARELDLSLAVGGSANSAGLAGAARADVGLRGQRFGLRVGVAAETERSHGIQSGSIAWRRYQLSAGPTLTLVRRPVMLEMGAEIFAGLTKAAGRNFDVDRESSAVASGLGLALRVGTSTGRLRPWLEIGGQYLLADQSITVTRPQLSDARSSLPSLQGRLFAGLSFVL